MATDAEQRIRISAARPTRAGALSELSLRQELARKALHLLSAAIPVAYAAGLPRVALVAVLAVGSAVALALELARARHGATRVVFTRVTGRLLRVHEHERWSGATWLLLAFLGATVLAPRDVAVTAMWAIAVGDAAAAMVGRSVARCAVAWRARRRSQCGECGECGERVNGSGKTFAGSAACFALTLMGALVLARVPVTEGLIAAAAAAAAERPSSRLNDNLRIAAAVVGGILLWRIMFS